MYLAIKLSGISNLSWQKICKYIYTVFVWYFVNTPVTPSHVAQHVVLHLPSVGKILVLMFIENVNCGPQWDLHEKRSAAHLVWTTWTKRNEEDGWEGIFNASFSKMAGPSFVFLLTWWHPGCPHPSTGTLSIFQPCLINPETTPRLSFHLPICPSSPRCLLPPLAPTVFTDVRSESFCWGQGSGGVRLQVIPHPLPFPLHPPPAPYTLHWSSSCSSLSMLSSLSLHPDHDHGQTVWKFRPLLTFSLQTQTAASLTELDFSWKHSPSLWLILMSLHIWTFTTVMEDWTEMQQTKLTLNILSMYQNMYIFNRLKSYF